jgi:hypothetical protein
MSRITDPTILEIAKKMDMKAKSSISSKSSVDDLIRIMNDLHVSHISIVNGEVNLTYKLDSGKSPIVL